jgi:hypothetical protein
MGFDPSSDAKVTDTAQIQKSAKAPIAATNDTIAARMREA